MSRRNGRGEGRSILDRRGAVVGLGHRERERAGRVVVCVNGAGREMSAMYQVVVTRRESVIVDGSARKRMFRRSRFRRGLLVTLKVGSIIRVNVM